MVRRGCPHMVGAKKTPILERFIWGGEGHCSHTGGGGRQHFSPHPEGRPTHTPLPGPQPLAVAVGVTCHAAPHSPGVETAAPPTCSPGPEPRTQRVGCGPHPAGSAGPTGPCGQARSFPSGASQVGLEYHSSTAPSNLAGSTLPEPSGPSSGASLSHHLQPLVANQPATSSRCSSSL